MLACGLAADAQGKYFQIFDDTVLLSMKPFCQILMDAVGTKYLRSSTEIDLKRTLCVSKARGIPGFKGCISCWHYKWKNFSVPQIGQFNGKGKDAYNCIIVIEGTSDEELYNR